MTEGGPRCKKCGRPLTNPESIAIGLGPKCAGSRPHRPRKSARSAKTGRPSSYSLTSPGHGEQKPLLGEIVMTELVALTETEEQDLHALETVIETGLQTFLDVGNALSQIRDRRLYRINYETFDDYCRERWGISRFYAHRTIAAAEAVDNLLPIGNKLPENEAQARPLTLLNDPESQQQAWETAVATAPGGRVTAAHVQTVVDDMRGIDHDDTPDPVIASAATQSPKPSNGKTKDKDQSPVFTDGRKILVGEIPNQIVITQLQDRPEWAQVQSFYHAVTPIADLINALQQLLDDDNRAGPSQDQRPAWSLPVTDAFPNPEAAQWFAIGRGAYPDPRTARKAYENLRDQLKPGSAREMAMIWIKHVHKEARLPAPELTI